MAIVALQLLPEPEPDDADAAALELPLELLLLLELPQPAATSAMSAVAAKITRTFIASNSSSGVGPDCSHTRGVRRETTRHSATPRVGRRRRCASARRPRPTG